jgi:pentatricopeptide repeat protein
MSTKRLLSANNFHPFPPMMKNYLQWAQNTPTQKSGTPFNAKGTSILATDLLKSYCERGLTSQARNLFDEMPERDVVAWTTMISGYTHCNEYTQAWSVFVDMVKNGNDPPNAFTISSVLKACKGMKRVFCGRLVHGLAIKRRFMEGFIYVDNALMDMYASCGVGMRDACVVFHDIKEKNVVSWTTLIAGYTHRGNGNRALQIFREMLLVSG